MSETKPTIKHAVPQSIVTQIGEVTVWFSLLESAIRISNEALIGAHDRTGQIITAELPFKKLRELLISLYREKHGDDDGYSILKALNKQTEATEKRRNQIVHSLWIAGNAPGTATRTKTTAKGKQGIQFHSELTNADDLIAVVDEIRMLTSKYMNFFGYVVTKDDNEPPPETETESQ